MITEDDIMTLAEPPEGFASIKYKNNIIYVSYDYYKNNDIYTPLGGLEAQILIEGMNLLFPNKDIVDAIWEQADIKLKPKPLTPTNTKDSNFYNNIADPKYFEIHNNIIEKQLSEHDTKNKLIAGHKKDIIVNQVRNRVTIYGWHRLNGEPIQPVSNAHNNKYKDYSHGLRFVFPMMQNSENKWVRFKY